MAPIAAIALADVPANMAGDRLALANTLANTEPIHRLLTASDREAIANTRALADRLVAASDLGTTSRRMDWPALQSDLRQAGTALRDVVGIFDDDHAVPVDDDRAPIGTAADPIFAAIDAHRKAIKAWDDARNLEQNHPLREAKCKAVKAWLRRDDRTEDDYPEEVAKPKDLIDAERHANALGNRESAARDELIATVPATLAGALAAIRYILGYYEGKGDIYPGQCHELLDDNALLDFIDRIGDAIEDALRRTHDAAT
jgi:hypothetical protein